MRKKIALVTGASRGIGKSVAEYLSGTGYFFVLIARNKTLLQNVLSEIKNKGNEGTYCTLDVSNADQVKSTVHHLVQAYGHIDLLFNNAGILKHSTSNVTDTDINELLKINLNGAIYIAKYVAGQMKKQRSGYIINLSFLGGKVAQAFSGVYAASKFGLSGYGEASAKELSSFGIKVTTICPSMTATEMTAGRKFTQDQMMETSDITKTIDYLLSLSPNALPIEIALHCLPFVEKTAQAIAEVYGVHSKEDEGTI